MRTEVKNYNRKELFDYYHQRSNPFVIITTKIDITNLYKLCKKNKNTYATIAYYLTSAMNEIDEFKYRYEDGKIYKYDVINPSFTQRFKDGNIGFFACDLLNDYDSFIKEFNHVQDTFLETNKSICKENNGDVWISCSPWFHFTSLIPPFDKSITTPQMIWDKFELTNDKCYINLMIMSHHGFTDASHIGLLINKINDQISNIDI